MPTSQADRYRATLRAMLDESWKLERDAVFRAKTLVQNYRDEVVAMLAQAPDNRTLLAQLQMVDEAALTFHAKFQTELKALGDGAYTTGAEMVGDALAVVDIMIPSMAGIDTRMLEIAQAAETDLIKGLSQEAATKVKTEIQRLAMGADFKGAVNTIASQIDTKLTFRSIDARARAIASTETARIYNMGSLKGIQESQEYSDRIVTQWIHARYGVRDPRPSHQRLHLQWVKKGGTFTLSGVQCRGPHDPALPAKEVVRCSCRSVPNVIDANGNAIELRGWAAWSGGGYNAVAKAA